MRLMWLAPVHLDKEKDIHPAPWISVLAKHLVKEKGVELSILNYQARLEKERVEFQKEGVRYIFLKTPAPKWDHLGFFKRRVAIIRDYLVQCRDDYDLVHVHGSEHQYEASVIGTGIPSVLSMQGIMTECVKQLRSPFSYRFISWQMSAWAESLNLRSVSDFICRTHFDSGYAKRKNPKATVHTNWEMIRPEFFSDLGNPESTKLLFMGGSHPLKGLDVLLQAFDILKRKEDLQLQILGGTDMNYVHQILERKSIDKSLLERIEFVGFLDVEGVVRAMDQSRLMVHCSMIDNSPNSICEAQVAGLPVVSVDVGGISSLMEDGRTGLLCDKTPESIANKVQLLLHNSALYDKIVNESRAMARHRHDAQTIVNQTISIYKKILKRA